MKRRNFLQATTMLPFLTDMVSGNKVLARNVVHGNNTYNFQHKSQHDFFYKPAGAWAADFIPLYDNGVFQLFYEVSNCGAVIVP